MTTPRRVTTAGGLSIEYAEAGTGRSVVLLLHGNFATWHWWRGLLSRPPLGVRFLAPTMRGCVGTLGGHRAEAFDVPSLAGDVLAFADALRVDRFHLVGHSLGGAIAQQCALSAPGRMTGLDLVASAPGDGLESMQGLGRNGGWLMRRFNPRRALDRAALLSSLQMARELGTSRRWFRRMLLRLMPGADLQAVGFEELVDDAVAMEPFAIVHLYRALAEWDVRSRRAELTVPTRVLAGKKDPLLPLPALETLARDIPGATVTVLDCAHAPMLELPAAFDAWLAEGVRAPEPVLERAGKRVGAWWAPPKEERALVPAPEGRLAAPQGRGWWARLRAGLRAIAAFFFGRPVGQR